MVFNKSLRSSENKNYGTLTHIYIVLVYQCDVFFDLRCLFTNANHDCTVPCNLVYDQNQCKNMSKQYTFLPCKELDLFIECLNSKSTTNQHLATNDCID